MPGGRLVQEQERRRRGQGARQLQPPLLAVRQVLRDLVGLGAERRPPPGASRPGSRARAPPGGSAGSGRSTSPGTSGMRLCMPDQDVLDHGHVGEQADVLERAAHAQGGDLVRSQPAQRLAPKGDLSAVGLVEPGEDVEERGLAGAVRPDDRADRPLLELKVHAGKGRQSAEALGDPFGRRGGRPSTRPPARGSVAGREGCPAGGRSSSG